MKRLAVIPARFASSRFPGKPLALILGKPMIQHVVDRCREAGCFDELVVATDDARIAKAVQGARVEMTSAHCPSGTDRVAEVARREDAELIINVQGDEPAVHPDALRALAAPCDEMATLVRPLRDDERSNRHVVKVSFDARGTALRFSREDLGTRWAHVGLYAYRRAMLLSLSTVAPTEREKKESLEQLRALDCGIRIECRRTEHEGCAVDTPDDIPRVEAVLRAR